MIRRPWSSNPRSTVSRLDKNFLVQSTALCAWLKALSEKNLQRNHDGSSDESWVSTDPTPGVDRNTRIPSHIITAILDISVVCLMTFQKLLAASRSSALSQSAPFANRVLHMLSLAKTGQPGVSQNLAAMPLSWASLMNLVRFPN